MVERFTFFDSQQDYELYLEALKVYDRAESIMGVDEVSSLQKQRIYLERDNVGKAIDEGEKLIQEEYDNFAFVPLLGEQGWKG